MASAWAISGSVPSDHDAVKATKHCGDLSMVGFDKGIHGDYLSHVFIAPYARMDIYTLGPGYAGLGDLCVKQ